MSAPAQASPPSGGNRTFFGRERAALALVFAAAAWLALESASPTSQLDDSFISYRYARNWVEGHGLVWNPGERVEGITNLLWTLAIAAGMALGVDAPLAGHALGVASGVALLVSVYALARANVPAEARWVAALAPFVVLASPALPYFATSGMETLAFLALATGALAADAHDRRIAAASLLALALALRPDAAIVAAVVVAAQLARDGWRPSARNLRPTLVVAAAGLALCAFRLAYYGSPVPNTFHAKVGGVPLAQAIEKASLFLIEAPIFAALPAIAHAMRGDRTARTGLAFCAATLAYVLATGGTALTFSRFLLPIFPVLAALGARSAARAVSPGERGAPLELACVVGCAAAYVAGTPWLGVGALAAGAIAAAISRRPAAGLAFAALGAALALAIATPHWRADRIASKRDFDAKLAANDRARAATLRERLPADATIGAVAIGVIGWETRFAVLDLLGLTDPVIARSEETVRGAVVVGMGHLRSNATYVLERHPAALLIGRDPGPATPALTAVRALWEHPDFARRYVWDERLDAYLARD